MATSASTDQTSADKGIYGLRHTVWDQQDITPIYPKICKDETTDVVIVGAGISGLSVAYNLVKEGKKVVVLEAKARGSGMTGRTTAHIMAWNDDFYYKISKQHGVDFCKLVGDSHRAAIDFVAQTVNEEGIDCNFSKVDGYLFPHEHTDKVIQEILYKEFETAKIAGFDVKMVNLNGDPACGKITDAILFPGNGDFHPLMYINGLARAIVKRGGKIYEQSRVTKNEEHKVITEDGVNVTADVVVLATNSPLNHNLEIHARQEAQRTYVIGFRIKKGSVKKAQWWDTCVPYHYVRTEQKEDYDVLIVGGNDNASGIKADDYVKLSPFISLEKWTRERWTAAEDILYTWTGQVYEPIDSLHLIGQAPIPTYGSNYIVTGDSGQGMTGGTIAGILIKDLILKRENPWANVYSPKRLPPLDKSTLQTTAEIVDHTVKGYITNRTPMGSDSIDIEDLVPDSGAIKQQGLNKVAIYKDKNGKLHKYSAVCSHMKCIVQWNPIDKTWDCPCHGSIFDAFGRCVNGPAKVDLTPV
ncbi:hypothetical protein KP509_38G028100 [Ceratopteris richardii]|nr:hypothetical protein KP509_38G028100 [Ceratopteris richardii]KAH7278174.1 hypothetical protein KP509_38G028100 [Ceratopteris richardii]KAH7278176.1 hypothetical protein KP509_38G028100 [Ceratopteris richardii]